MTDRRTGSSGRKNRGSNKSKKDSKEQRLRRKARQHVTSAAANDRSSLVIGSVAMIASSYCVQGMFLSSICRPLGMTLYNYIVDERLSY